MLILSGLVFEAALLFVSFASFEHVTLWELTTREPVILTTVCAVAIALAAASMLTERAFPLLLATCISFYLFGRAFPTGAGDYDAFGVGFWLSVGASVGMSLGGVVALTAASFARPS